MKETALVDLLLAVCVVPGYVLAARPRLVVGSERVKANCILPDHPVLTIFPTNRYLAGECHVVVAPN